MPDKFKRNAKVGAEERMLVAGYWILVPEIDLLLGQAFLISSS